MSLTVGTLTRRPATTMSDVRRSWSGTGRPDVVVAGLLALASITEAVGWTTATGTGQFAIAVWLFALGTPLLLVLPRPVGAALAVTGAALFSLLVFRVPTVGAAVAEVIAVYRLGRRGSAWVGTQVVAGVLALPFVVLALFGTRSSEAGVLTVLLAVAVPTAAWVGFAARARADARVHRAAREIIAGTMVEHTARGERARIARELHDVVAHHISMIAVQAETARLTTPGMPAAGAHRLLEIGDTARAGLTEMRRLLSVLREDAYTEVAGRRPQPGLQQLNELLDEARDANGAATRLIVSGAPVELDPGVELAAYRIVQEALTNARRHAPGAATDVELRYAGDGLRLRIRDNGPGPQAGSPAGHGLLGMRERAAAVGGTLCTGSAMGGGFLVAAVLPVKTGQP